MVQLTLPQLSLSTEGGKALCRLGTDGDGIGKGQPVVEVETDKTTIGVEAIRGGIIRLLAEGGRCLRSRCAGGPRRRGRRGPRAGAEASPRAV